MWSKKLMILAAAILVLTPVLAVAQAAAPATPAPAVQAPAAAAPATPKAAEPMKDMMMAGKHDAATCPCPNCPMKEEATGARDAHGQQMHMMMSAKITKDDPEAVLGMREELKLTPEQTKQLEQIQAETRAKVAGILSAEQKTELAKLPAEATSMREMHKQMMAKKTEKPAEAEPGAIDKPKEETATRGTAPAPAAPAPIK